MFGGWRIAGAICWLAAGRLFHMEHGGTVLLGLAGLAVLERYGELSLDGKPAAFYGLQWSRKLPVRRACRGQDSELMAFGFLDFWALVLLTFWPWPCGLLGL